MQSRTRICSVSITLVALTGCGGDGDDPANAGVDCTLFTPAAVSPHVLPWHPGHTFKANPHLKDDRSVQKFAIDVAMPIGTDVLAMRAGTVASVEESFFDGDLTPGHANFVLIRHEDGTAARYFHLTHAGALVSVGDEVAQGEPIGLSGHTGHSSEPHLHFDVTRYCCSTPPNHNLMPAGETLPLSFSNAAPDSSCGLTHGASYTAGS